MKACHGCGTPLPPLRAPGRERKWCSDQCRKAQYDLVCVDCGGRVNGTTPGRLVGREPRCPSCAWAISGPVNAARERAKVQARRDRIVAMWNAGASMPEIAQAVGCTTNALGVTMVKMRRDGWHLPYRYAVREGRRVAA